QPAWLGNVALEFFLSGLRWGETFSDTAAQSTINPSSPALSCHHPSHNVYPTHRLSPPKQNHHTRQLHRSPAVPHLRKEKKQKWRTQNCQDGGRFSRQDEGRGETEGNAAISSQQAKRGGVHD